MTGLNGAVSLQWTGAAWPVTRGAGAAGMVTVTATDPASGEDVRVQRWFDEAGTRSLRSWPQRSDARVPWVMWRPEGGERVVTAGIDRLAGSEELATARIDAAGRVHWEREASGEIAGLVVRGLVLGLADALAAGLTANVSPDDGGVVETTTTGDEPVLRAWHVTDGSRILRALETSPVDDEVEDVIRARVAWLVDGAAPLQSGGVLVATAAGLRWWPTERSTLVDEPLTGADDFPAAVRALGASLSEALRGAAPPTRAR